MAYNTELLKKAGIDKPATSWDELTAQAKKMTQGDEYGMALAYKDNFDPWKLIWGMSVQAGNPILEGKTASLDNPAVKKAYETYFGWLTDDKVVDPAAVGWSNSQALAAFAEGKTGYMLFTSSLSALTFDKSAIKGKYAYALMPTVPPGATSRPANGVEAASILSGDNYVVADYSKDQDLAFQLVKMLTDKESQLEQHETFGVIPVNKEAAATLESDPKLKTTLDALDKSVATPFNGAWGDVQLALTNVVVQTIPDLSQGSVSSSSLDARIAEAQKTAQSAAERSK
jgi:multiple sugar transport system substrate-binding protein